LNGNVSSPELALQAMSIVGADGIMIARASVGNPFLFRQAKELIEKGSYSEVSNRERIDCCLRHLSYSIEFKGMRGLMEFRKHYSGYLRGMYNLTPVRQKLVVSENFEEIKDILEDYYNNVLNIAKL